MPSSNPTISLGLALLALAAAVPQAPRDVCPAGSLDCGTDSAEQDAAQMLQLSSKTMKDRTEEPHKFGKDGDDPNIKPKKESEKVSLLQARAVVQTQSSSEGAQPPDAEGVGGPGAEGAEDADVPEPEPEDSGSEGSTESMMQVGTAGQASRVQTKGASKGGDCSKECDKKPQYSYMSFKGMVRRRRLGGYPTSSKLLYYRKSGAPTLTSSTAIPAKKVVVVFHGVGGNPDTYYCYVENALRASAYAEEDFYIAALGFLDEKQAVGDTHRRRRRHMTKNKALYWPFHRDWMYLKEPASFKLSSNAVLDYVVGKIVNPAKFPNLEEIVLAGHGGGAQFVHRYAVVNNVDTGAVKITYIVANPSTLLYLTKDRPVLPKSLSALAQKGCSHFDAQEFKVGASSFATPANLDNPWFGSMKDHGGKEYLVDDCSEFDSYEFGLSGAPDYFPNAAVLKERFRLRHVLYVAAHHDSCNKALDNMLSDLDVTCSYCCDTVVGTDREGDCIWNNHELKYPIKSNCQAMMQGLTRVERAWHYWDYLTLLYGKNHSQKFHPVNGRHSSCEIFISKEGQNILFGDSR